MFKQFTVWDRVVRSKPGDTGDLFTQKTKRKVPKKSTSNRPTSLQPSSADASPTLTNYQSSQQINIGDSSGKFKKAIHSLMTDKQEDDKDGKVPAYYKKIIEGNEKNYKAVVTLAETMEKNGAANANIKNIMVVLFEVGDVTFTGEVSKVLSVQSVYCRQFDMFAGKLSDIYRQQKGNDQLQPLTDEQKRMIKEGFGKVIKDLETLNNQLLIEAEKPNNTEAIKQKIREGATILKKPNDPESAYFFLLMLETNPTADDIDLVLKLCKEGYNNQKEDEGIALVVNLKDNQDNTALSIVVNNYLKLPKESRNIAETTKQLEMLFKYGATIDEKTMGLMTSSRMSNPEKTHILTAMQNLQENYCLRRTFNLILKAGALSKSELKQSTDNIIEEIKNKNCDVNKACIEIPSHKSGMTYVVPAVFGMARFEDKLTRKCIKNQEYIVGRLINECNANLQVVANNGKGDDKAALLVSQRIHLGTFLLDQGLSANIRNHKKFVKNKLLTVEIDNTGNKDNQGVKLYSLNHEEFYKDVNPNAMLALSKIKSSGEEAVNAFDEQVKHLPNAKILRWDDATRELYNILPYERMALTKCDDNQKDYRAVWIPARWQVERTIALALGYAKEANEHGRPVNPLEQVTDKTKLDTIAVIADAITQQQLIFTIEAKKFDEVDFITVAKHTMSAICDKNKNLLPDWQQKVAQAAQVALVADRIRAKATDKTADMVLVAQGVIGAVYDKDGTLKEGWKDQVEQAAKDAVANVSQSTYPSPSTSSNPSPSLTPSSVHRTLPQLPLKSKSPQKIATKQVTSLVSLDEALVGHKGSYDTAVSDLKELIPLLKKHDQSFDDKSFLGELVEIEKAVKEWAQIAELSQGMLELGMSGKYQEYREQVDAKLAIIKAGLQKLGVELPLKYVPVNTNPDNIGDDGYFTDANIQKLFTERAKKDLYIKAFDDDGNPIGDHNTKHPNAREVVIVTKTSPMALMGEMAKDIAKNHKGRDILIPTNVTLGSGSKGEGNHWVLTYVEAGEPRTLVFVDPANDASKGHTTHCEEAVKALKATGVLNEHSQIRDLSANQQRANDMKDTDTLYSCGAWVVEIGTALAQLPKGTPITEIPEVQLKGTVNGKYTLAAVKKEYGEELISYNAKEQEVTLSSSSASSSQGLPVQMDLPVSQPKHPLNLKGVRPENLENDIFKAQALAQKYAKGLKSNEPVKELYIIAYSEKEAKALCEKYSKDKTTSKPEIKQVKDGKIKNSNIWRLTYKNGVAQATQREILDSYFKQNAELYANSAYKDDDTARYAMSRAIALSAVAYASRHGSRSIALLREHDKEEGKHEKELITYITNNINRLQYEKTETLTNQENPWATFSTEQLKAQVDVREGTLAEKLSTGILAHNKNIGVYEASGTKEPKDTDIKKWKPKDIHHGIIGHLQGGEFSGYNPTTDYYSEFTKAFAKELKSASNTPSVSLSVSQTGEQTPRKEEKPVNLDTSSSSKSAVERKVEVEIIIPVKQLVPTATVSGSGTPSGSPVGSSTPVSGTQSSSSGSSPKPKTPVTQKTLPVIPNKTIVQQVSSQPTLTTPTSPTQTPSQKPTTEVILGGESNVGGGQPGQQTHVQRLSSGSKPNTFGSNVGGSKQPVIATQPNITNGAGSQPTIPPSLPNSPSPELPGWVNNPSISTATTPSSWTNKVSPQQPNLNPFVGTNPFQPSVPYQNPFLAPVSQPNVPYQNPFLTSIPNPSGKPGIVTVPNVTNAPVKRLEQMSVEERMAYYKQSLAQEKNTAQATGNVAPVKRLEQMSVEERMAYYKQSLAQEKNTAQVRGNVAPAKRLEQMSVEERMAYYKQSLAQEKNTQPSNTTGQATGSQVIKLQQSSNQKGSGIGGLG